MPNLAIFLFLMYTKMVNNFFSYRTAIQEGSDYFESSIRKLLLNDLVWQSLHKQQQILLHCGICIAQKQNEAYGEICFQIPTKIPL